MATRILEGDVRERLRELPDASVQAQYERNRQLKAAMTLARPKRKGRKAGVVVGLDGKRVAALVQGCAAVRGERRMEAAA